MNSQSHSDTDQDFDPKAVVAKGYDRCAQAYAAARSQEAPRFLSLLTERLSDGAKVLDIGCGCGCPIAATLAARFKITGVDISREQIRLARKHVPSGEFVHADATALDLKVGEFDAVIMLYSLFHIPRDEHPSFLGKLRSWLRRGGLLLATLSQHSDPSHTEDDFFGSTMYWSNFSKAETAELLHKARFFPLWEGTTSHGYADQNLKPESHPVALLEAVGGYE